MRSRTSASVLRGRTSATTIWQFPRPIQASHGAAAGQSARRSNIAKLISAHIGKSSCAKGDIAMKKGVM